MIVISVLPLKSGFPCQELTSVFAKLNSDAGTPDNEKDVEYLFPRDEKTPEGYLKPVIYVRQKPKQKTRRVIQNGQLLEVDSIELEFKSIKLYIPSSSYLPALAIGAGNKPDALGTLRLFQEAKGKAAEEPYYSLADFNLSEIANKYPEEHWLWNFKNGSGYVTSGRLTGEGIERDAVVQAVKQGSTPNEVGIIFQVQDASLKVRILRAGRVQFTQFTDEHLVEFKHPELGNPWPMITQVLGTLEMFR